MNIACLRLRLHVFLSMALVGSFAWAANPVEVDLVIYGGTSSGIAAAVQAKRMGMTCVVIEPTDRIGGLTTGGLGQTDIGNKSAIGGIAREFYQDIAKHYADEEAWKWQRREEYRSGGQSRTAQGEDTMWTFEPSAALKVFQKWIEQNKVDVVYGERLERASGVKMTGSQPQQIEMIEMESGKAFRGKVFIDATYEGDLLASAGVSYTVGREANSQYGETLNGVQTRMAKHHQLKPGIDPYVVPGDPQSGLLPHIDPEGPGVENAADSRVQAYCFRMCLTNHPDNRIPFHKPAGYRQDWYELLLRNYEAGETAVPWANSAMPNRKTDTNNRTGFSSDFIGQNYDYPEASYDDRARIAAQHHLYQQGLMWTLANDARVPKSVRSTVSRWGMCQDEFTEGNGWQQQLYVREARRMVGEYVMTQKNCQGLEVSDPIGLAAYTMDSHNQQRYVDDQGHVRNEGDVQVGGFSPYGISYRSIVPKRAEVANLVVPVCLSASHIAFGSIRMEPVFMVLGQSAATAASLAIKNNGNVHDVDYSQLAERLVADGQVLKYTGPKKISGIDASKLPGIVVDNAAATTKGPWTISSSSSPHIATDYLHDGDTDKGECIATFEAKLPEPGKYRVKLYWPPFSNRATNVKVTVIDSMQKHQVVYVNQRDKASRGVRTLGEFSFGEAGTVEISNADSDGHVIADAVSFERVVNVSQNGISQNGAAKRQKAKAGSPNVLLIFADDLGFETLGCYGGLDFKTPNLDRLASQGMRFDRAYTSPVCTPSRMSLYTGTYASRHGYDRVLPIHVGSREKVDFANRFVSYPQLLRQAGYATSVTGKWQLAALEFHPDHCRDAGFDSWCVWQIWKDGKKTTRYWQPTLNHDGNIRDDIDKRYGPDVLTEYVISQMKDAVDRGQPFFIHHNMMLPHWPILPTQADKDHDREASLESMIEYADAIVGQLTDAVDNLGIAEDTYIVFMGDNGTDSKKPRRTKTGLVHGGKRDLNDGGTHIPLILRRPGAIPTGSIAEDLIDIADCFPTFCELTQTEMPDGLTIDGVSFAGRLLQNEPTSRRYVTAGYSGKLSVFDGEFRVTTGEQIAKDNGTKNTKRLNELRHVLQSLPR